MTVGSRSYDSVGATRTIRMTVGATMTVGSRSYDSVGATRTVGSRSYDSVDSVCNHDSWIKVV